MNDNPSSHPFLLREHAHNIIEVIAVEGDDDSVNRILTTIPLVARKYPHVILTLPPGIFIERQFCPLLEKISKQIKVKVAYLKPGQIKFPHSFLETHLCPTNAVGLVKAAIISEVIADHFSEVTPFKTSALNILNLVNSSDVSFADIEKEVNNEPLLIARILQTANSVFFMRRSRVENIGHALAYLGLEGIRQVLVEMIFNNLATKYFAQQEQKLKHTMHCATLAVKLAERVTRDKLLLGKVRVAALLHDIGALAIQFAYREEYEKVHRIIKQQGLDIVRAERNIFSIDHCQIAKIICEDWNLPEYVTFVATNHHNWPQGIMPQIIEPVVCANGFLNLEKEGVSYMDYTPLLVKYSSSPAGNQDEAIAEVKDFLNQEYDKIKES